MPHEWDGTATICAEAECAQVSVILAMLREEEIRIDTGLAAHGGDFLRIEHLPTGIERCHPGPLADVDRHHLVEQWLAEIEAELKEEGLTEFIVPAYPKKSRWQGKRRS